MKGNPDAVFTRALEAVDNGDSVAGFVEHDGAYRRHRIGQAVVAGMGADEPIGGVRYTPMANLGIGVVMQRPQVFRLDEAILLLAADDRRIVKPGRAEIVAPLGIGGIDVSPAIGDQRHPFEHRLE